MFVQKTVGRGHYALSRIAPCFYGGIVALGLLHSGSLVQDVYGVAVYAFQSLSTVALVMCVPLPIRHVGVCTYTHSRIGGEEHQLLGTR